MDCINKYPVTSAFLRTGFYILIMWFVSRIFLLESTGNTAIIKFGENSLIEITQEVLLIISMLLLWFFAFRQPFRRGFLIFIAMMLNLALIREFNNFLNDKLAGGWQLVFYIFLVFYGLILLMNRKTIPKAFVEFLKLPSFGVMLSGFLIVAVFSRLFGKKEIWQNILIVDFLNGPYRAVKNAVEEGTELLGYSLIFIAIIEYLMYILKERKDLSE